MQGIDFFFDNGFIIRVRWGQRDGRLARDVDVSRGNGLVDYPLPGFEHSRLWTEGWYWSIGECLPQTAAATSC